MKTVIDSQGQEIGLFDGNTIKDKDGSVVYFISDGEVFAPNEYEDSDLQHFNKGKFSKIGIYDGRKCTSGNQLIFEII